MAGIIAKEPGKPFNPFGIYRLIETANTRPTKQGVTNHEEGNQGIGERARIQAILVTENSESLDYIKKVLHKLII